MSGSPTHIGAFELLERIGSGGSAEVYLARRSTTQSIDQLVAIKVVRAPLKLHPELSTILADEARALARVDDPIVPHLVELGQDGEHLFVAMEYVAGQSFAAILTAHGAWPVGVATAAIVEICYGLHRLHAARDLVGRHLRLVHRDLTPSNLMLTFSGRPRLLDLGGAIHRERTAQPTAPGEVRGTPPYLSPEQLQGHAVDARADLYSLGVVLAELVCGERVVRATTPIGVLREVCDGDGVTPRVAAMMALHGAIAPVVVRATERSPDARYPTAVAFASALQAALPTARPELLHEFAGKQLVGARRAHEANLRRLLGLNDANPWAAQTATAPSRRPPDGQPPNA